MGPAAAAGASAALSTAAGAGGVGSPAGGGGAGPPLGAGGAAGAGAGGAGAALVSGNAAASNSGMPAMEFNLASKTLIKISSSVTRELPEWGGWDGREREWKRRRR